MIFLEKNDFVLPGTDLTFSGVWWILVGRVVIDENGNYKATDTLSGSNVSRTQSTVTVVRIRLGLDRKGQKHRG